MTRAVLSIGSNQSDPLVHLRAARAAFAEVLVAESTVYETEPWGLVEQAAFLNAVLVVDDPSAGAGDWLRRAHEVEDAAGRARTVRWGPRTLDVDLVTVTDGGVQVRSDDPVLTLPHPRVHERAFVLVPWLEVEPAAQIPGHGSVYDVLTELGADGVEGRADLSLR